MAALSAIMAMKGSVLGNEYVDLDAARGMCFNMSQSLMSLAFPFAKMGRQVAVASKKEKYEEMFRRLREIEKRRADAGEKDSADTHNVEEGPS